MTQLSDAELQSLHEQMGRLSGSGTGGAPAAPLARGRSASDTARLRLEEASPTVLGALEDTLSARTHRPWQIDLVAVRAESAAELMGAVGAPSMGVSPEGPLVLVDQDVARRLVTLLLGLDGVEESSATMGALDHHAIARVLRGVADDVASALATFLAKPAPRPAIAESGWRNGARHLGAAVATVAVELKEPIQGRLWVAVPLPWLERPPKSAEAKSAAAAEEPMRAHLADVEVQLAVELGAVAMPLGALAELAAGTLLPLATTESTPLPVYVEGVQRFHARPQALEDGRVIVTLVDPESP